MRVRFAILLVSSLFVSSFMLSGCIPPAYIALTPEQSNKIKTVKARSIVVPDEAIARADPSSFAAAVGGGAIPALIDAGITKSRQDQLQVTMAQFYESVDDYDFRAQYWPNLTQMLKTQYPLKVVDVTTTARSVSMDELQAIRLSLPNDEGFLLLWTDYFLTPDLRSLMVTTHAAIWLKSGEDAVYRNKFTYYSAPAGAGGADSAKAWAAKNGARFEETANEGIRESIKMLRLDLKTDAPKAGASQVDIKFQSGASIPYLIKGAVIDQSGSRQIVRDTVGHLHSIQP